MQVLGIVTWNKNLHAVQGALGGAKDIGEAEGVLAAGVRTDRVIAPVARC